MRRGLLMTILGLGLALPGTALAAGGPVPAVQGGSGVSAPGGRFSFIALPAGRNTIVERVWHLSGIVDVRTRIAGSFGVPGAAYDGSTTGLSADGRTLILAQIPAIYPPSKTQLLVLDALTLRVEARITFPGYFTVDAIAPTGRWLYLLHYRTPVSNPFDYEVRVYDLVTRQLLAKPVVDPREPDEKMQGYPVTRTMSADGRWAYTLYGRISGTPFIHALDTAARSAYCVDLPASANADLASAKLVLLSGSTLSVESQGAVLALMDRRTFAVRLPAPVPLSAPVRHPPARTAHRTSSPPGRGSDTWTYALPLLAVLFGLALTVARRQRPREDSNLRPTA